MKNLLSNNQRVCSMIGKPLTNLQFAAIFVLLVVVSYVIAHFWDKQVNKRVKQVNKGKL